MRLHCWGRAGQRVQGPGGPLGVWSLPKEKGPSRGFRRRRLHQSHVLERSLTAGWRTAQRGQNQIKLEAGGRGGGGWDSPGLARSPGPSQEASQVPSLWALLAAETVRRAHHPEGPPPQLLPAHRWEGEVLPRRGPQPAGLGHTLFSTQTPASHAPLHGRLQGPVHLTSGSSSAVSGEDSRATAQGHRPISQVRAPRPERGPQTRAFCLPGLRPPGSPHGTLYRSAIRGECSLLPRSRAACSLKHPGHGACPQGPLLRLCRR